MKQPLVVALACALACAVSAQSSKSIEWIFIGGGDAAFHAIDKTTGRNLRSAPVAETTGTPMTYLTSSGRQFVVIATRRGAGANAGRLRAGPAAEFRKREAVMESLSYGRLHSFSSGSVRRRRCSRRNRRWSEPSRTKRKRSCPASP
jgi:hypothetical protein